MKWVDSSVLASWMTKNRFGRVIMVEAQVWPSQLAECAGSSVLLSSMEEAECGQVMMAEA